MPTDRWRQIEEVFSEALDQPSGMRAPFVARRCGFDARMRADITSLLQAAEASGDFLAVPALDVFARQISREGWSVRSGDRIAAYTIAQRLGAGGMGEVWRARDERLGRDVAIKLLLPHPSDVAGRVQAFEREARAAGALNHPNVLTVHDVGDHRGAPYLVMECLEGEALRARLTRGVLPVDEALDVALQAARGLGAAHARGIVHRDLKPENLFLASDGRVKILDFGLATLRESQPEPSGLPPQSDLSALPLAGGTAGYMAPEQMRGETVDCRADIFALGAVLYEVLAGVRPFRADSAAGTLDAAMTREPRDLSDLNPQVSRALSRIVRRCLATSPDARFATGNAVASALETVVRGRLPQAAPTMGAFLRRPGVLAAVVLILLVAGGGGWRWHAVSARTRWAHAIAAPEIQRLASHGDFGAAFLLARRALDAVPDHPQLRQLWLDVTARAAVITDPPGADVTVAPYEPSPAEWFSLGRTPLTGVRIPRGMSRFRISKAGFQPIDGAGHPQPGGIRFKLDPVDMVPVGMVRVPRGRDPVRFRSIGELDDYWIDRFEVTNRQFKEFVDRGGYREQTHWREPFVDRGRSVTWETAMQGFRDRTGRPGPATWTGGMYPDGQAEFPVGGVSWYEAAAYAHFSGKSLPTRYHWYRAAALGRFADILTLSNFGGTGPAAVGRSGGLGPFGTYDMAGNLKEWCWNETGYDRFLLGGAWNEPRYLFGDDDARGPFERAAGYGMRLAKYDRPLPGEVTAPVPPSSAAGTIRRHKPVRDEIFDVYRRQSAYDRTPLNVILEATEDAELWVKVTVAFDAAYGGERVRAYLFLPKSGPAPPYQAVVFFPAGDAFQLGSSRDMGLGAASLIVRSGRAFLYPVYKGTYERSVPDSGLNAERELRIAWSRDLGRALDYLETRPDIDRTRFAFYGISSGADAGVMLTALESRLKASVLQGTGLWDAAAPEIDPRTYAPRVRVPTLMLNGRYDFVMPFASTQQPLFELLGTRPEHKRHEVFETGHALPTAEIEGVILAWLDRYLGPVGRS
jgi:eukaryotic-like serine/threonine-protein kinase